MVSNSKSSQPSLSFNKDAQKIQLLPVSFLIDGKFSSTGPIKVTKKLVHFVTVLIVSEWQKGTAINGWFGSALVKLIETELEKAMMFGKVGPNSHCYVCKLMLKRFINIGYYYGPFFNDKRSKQELNIISETEERVYVSWDFKLSLGSNLPCDENQLVRFGYTLYKVKGILRDGDLILAYDSLCQENAFVLEKVATAIKAHAKVNVGQRALLQLK